MINIIDDALAVSNIDQGLQDRHDVFVIERAAANDLIAAETTIELHSTHGRQIVTIRRKEKVLE